MPENNLPQKISPFQPNIRREWFNNEWYYTIVDIIEFLTESTDPGSYWHTMKRRLLQEENAKEALEQIEQLKIKGHDGRFRPTDTANQQTILRLIQSIPSPRAEPLKLWLAKVGNERLEEIEHPEQALERVKQNYRAKGYDDAWIEARIENDLTRNRLTDEWKFRGAKEGQEFAILTNTIHEGTFEITIQHHKKHKVLPTRANLRDHMTPLELILTSLSEATAVTLHQDRESQGFSELKEDADDASKAGKEAREAIEKQIGRSVISSQNYLENTKRKHQKRIEHQQKPPLPGFDQSEEGQ